MGTYWTEYQDELKRPECHECFKVATLYEDTGHTQLCMPCLLKIVKRISCHNCDSTMSLFYLDYELWCIECLQKEEIDDEPSLSNEERNE